MEVTMKHYKICGGQYQKISKFTLISEDRKKPSQLWVDDKMIGSIEEAGLPSFLGLFDSLIVEN